MEDFFRGRVKILDPFSSEVDPYSPYSETHILWKSSREYVSWFWTTVVLLMPGGVLAEKLARGVRPASQKPLPYLWPKSSIFPTLFMT